MVSKDPRVGMRTPCKQQTDPARQEGEESWRENRGCPAGVLDTSCQLCLVSVKAVLEPAASSGLWLSRGVQQQFCTSRISPLARSPKGRSLSSGEGQINGSSWPGKHQALGAPGRRGEGYEPTLCSRSCWWT